MYAYILESGCGFFDGVCEQVNRPPTFRDPPLPPRDVRIARGCPAMRNEVIRLGRHPLSGAYAVCVEPAGPVLEEYLVPRGQLTQVVEDHAAPGSPKAHAVSWEVEVPLSTL